MANRILIVDDEEGIRLSLSGVLEDEGHEVITASSAEEALEVLEAHNLDLIFLDIWLPGMDGLEALETIQSRQPGLPVVMISGHGNIETAVNAIKIGAFDFIEKPLSLEKVVIVTNKALEFFRLTQENRLLRSRMPVEEQRNLTGDSRAIDELREQIQRVAPTEAWVLITGENGTGKEIVARSLHGQSRRADKLLVAVNCAAIPEDLIENELFGHEKGAFTGAETSEAGKFEMAHKGTLFLDEIADMSLKTQAKILRILQEQSFERVGGRRTIKVDVRVIAATNKDLQAEIKAGNFREDLYYRLKVFPLHVPPLRQRPQDIPLLIEDFASQMIREYGMRPISFHPEAMVMLEAYPWPGNVRELKNMVERLLIMHAGGEVGPEDLPPEFHIAESVAMNDPDLEQCLQAAVSGRASDFKEARNQFEARFLEIKYREFQGNVSRLAEAIGLERSYLYRKLKSYGIQ